MPSTEKAFAAPAPRARQQMKTTLPDDFSPELRAELIDDFHAEADEYLSNIRTQLDNLDRALKDGRSNPAALENLFRCMHSLKGICSIVGLRKAEELAHGAEDFLRQLTRAEMSLDDAGLQTLIDAAHRLEQVVSAHRLKQALPDIAPVLADLAAYRSKAVVRPVSPSTPGPPATPPPVPLLDLETLQSQGCMPWRCLFSPTKVLDARGVNVNEIRSRLERLGLIVRATPQVRPGGSITFEFIAALRETPTNLSKWEEDGAQLSPLETALTHDKPSDTLKTSTGEPASSLFIAPSHIVRVDLSRLDELMRITGELVIHRSRLDERLQRTVGALSHDRTGLQEINVALMRSLRELRNAIATVRLVSMGEIFTRMPFVIRDLNRESGKKALLVLEGQQTQVDKYVVERLKEPLLHLVRNALSHGVETPAERTQVGKTAEATILLEAKAEGEWVVIRIRDDGRGVDADSIAKRARELGLAVPEKLDTAALLEILCAPGFSTRKEADFAAGRGVGMAVVHTTVRELGGSLSLETGLGQWTQFTLRLPLTLSILSALIVSMDDQKCAVPQKFVEEIVQVPAAHLRSVSRVETMPYRGALLPLIRLRSLFGRMPEDAENITVLVLGSDRALTGLVVDRVFGTREVVVRPLQDPLVRGANISGATELGDGRPVLILDAATLTSGVFRSRASAALGDRAAHPK